MMSCKRSSRVLLSAQGISGSFDSGRSHSRLDSFEALSSLSREESSTGGRFDRWGCFFREPAFALVGLLVPAFLAVDFDVFLVRAMTKVCSLQGGAYLPSRNKPSVPHGALPFDDSVASRGNIF